MATNIIPPQSKAAKPFMGTREEAKLAAAVRYIDGRPCNRNHAPTIRLTSNTQCVTCRDMKQAEIKTVKRLSPGFIDGMELRGRPVYRGTRRQAEAVGCMYYINERTPCPKGHSPCIRLTSTTARTCCSAEYHNEHRDVINAGKRQHRADNPELYSAIGKARYAANPEYFKAYAASWLAKNYDYKRGVDVIWREENAQNLKDYWAEWGRTHPNNVAAKSHNRRSRKLGSLEQFCAADVQRIFESQGPGCAYCWKPLTAKTKFVDHFMPLAKNGSNGADNLICACQPCNSRKSSRDPLEFVRSSRERLLTARALHGEPIERDPTYPILLIIDGLLL